MDPTLEKIISARTDLVIDQPFFGVLAIRLRLIAEDWIPTMGTDGTRLIYNPKFVNSLTMPELKAVLCHEVLHCSNGHPWREDARDHERWNHACDYAINPIVRDCGMTLPKDALLDAKYEGMSAEQIYAILPPSKKCKGCGMGEILRPGEYDQAGEPQATQGDWKVATMQAATAAKMRGNLPGALSQLIDEIINPKVDWRTALQNIVQQALAKDDYSWVRPNTRYLAGGMFLPALRSEKVPPIGIYSDASGSCWSKKILTDFAAEINGISAQCKPEAIYVDYFDTRVNEGDEYGPGEHIVLEPKGGGGTDFRPIFDHVRDSGRELACVIVLTDGYGAFPDVAPEYPVVWAMNTSVEAPWGTTLDIR